MAYAMGWFQVICPQCAAALQVKLPAGCSSVECSQCKSAFGVQVDVQALPHRERSQPSRRARQSTSNDARRRTPTMELYSTFMKEEMQRIRREKPELASKRPEHVRQVFQMAANNWASAPTNSKTAAAQDAAAGGSGSGSGGTAAREEQATGHADEPVRDVEAEAMEVEGAVPADVVRPPPQQRRMRQRVGASDGR
mmetsp:Transcript_51412/g.151567  ORF Transcript_51412/g.151567 Transcript_51412/m.151567 type:complete len:196 (+) Transcript_51412:83-670(+)